MQSDCKLNDWITFKIKIVVPSGRTEFIKKKNIIFQIERVTI